MPPETWTETGFCTCGGDHYVWDCPKALEPDPDEGGIREF